MIGFCRVEDFFRRFRVLDRIQEVIYFVNTVGGLSVENLFEKSDFHGDVKSLACFEIHENPTI